MDKNYNLRLDLQFRCNNSVMKFDEFDKNTSDFFIGVTRGNKLIDISKAIVTLVTIKPDNTTEAQFVTIENNNVYCDLKPSMKDIPGKYEAIASITVDEETINTDKIVYEVTENKFLRQLNEEVVSEERFSILTEMINRLSTIENDELSRQEAELSREEAEKLRQEAIEKIKSDMAKLIEDTNSKVDINLKENSNKVDKLISDTETKIDKYKLEKDAAINLDLQQYKTDTTQDIDNYKNLKDAEIDEQMNRLDVNENIRINQEKARVASENNRVEEFEVIKEDYNTYKNVMISESNVAALQNQINNNSSQIKDKANKLNSKIDEVANSGTTVEAVQNKVSEMVEQGLIQAYTIGDNTVEPRKTTFIKDGVNKLNFPKITDNHFMDANGNSNENNSYFLTDYIEIPYRKQAVLTCKNEYGARRTWTFRMSTVYETDKTILISEGNNSSSYFWKNNNSNTTKLVRFSIAKNNYTDWQIELIDCDIEYDGTAIDFISGCKYFSEFQYKLEEMYIENTNISIFNNDVGFIRKDEIENIIPNILYVSQSYSNEDDGFGITKFSSIIEAHESIIDNSKNNQYKIIVKPGTYNFGGIWTGDITDVYGGILLKDYVYIESENIERPQDYIITWNGADDYPAGTIISDKQALKRCPFHITQDSQHCGVSGFTFNCSNIRYCIHPETNTSALGKTSEGYLQEINIFNNIFNWGGRTNCENQSSIAVACGLAPASKIHFKRCKFNGGNLGFHNNEWHSYYGEKPFIVQGSYALIEECVFNNQPITYSVMFEGADTYEVLHIKDCRGISAITIGDKISSKQKLTLKNEGSEIKGIITNPFE